jgi:iron complex outermembrane receptor protein
VEIGVKSEPIEGIELTTNYVYTFFKYDNYFAVMSTPSVDTIIMNFTGNTVPSVPRHILNFILNYEFEITEKISGLLQWDCDYISKMYVDDKNSESVPGYFYGNWMAGLNFSYKIINLIGYLGTNNVFDRRYAGFININDFDGRSYETGEPRNIYGGLKISYKF